MKCSVDGCANKKWALGFCGAHYRRLKTKGSTGNSPLRTKPGSLISWLRENSRHDGDECLLWPFTRDSRGYGQIRVNGVRTSAHRVMCEIANGPVDRSIEAAHSCGNGACLNPKHIRWATRAQNEADKASHGTRPRGEKSGSSKLTEEQARWVLSMKGMRTAASLSTELMVSASAIERIMSGKSWTHIQQAAEEGMAA